MPTIIIESASIGTSKIKLSQIITIWLNLTKYQLIDRTFTGS